MSVIIPESKKIEIYPPDIYAGYMTIGKHRILLVSQNPDCYYTKEHVFASLDYCIDFIKTDNAKRPKIIIADLPAQPAKDLVLYVPRYVEYFKAFAQMGAYLYIVTNPKVSNTSTFLLGIVQRSSALSLRMFDSMQGAVDAVTDLLNEWDEVVEHSDKIQIQHN